jgi:hypothetical protein
MRTLEALEVAAAVSLTALAAKDEWGAAKKRIAAHGEVVALMTQVMVDVRGDVANNAYPVAGSPLSESGHDWMMGTPQ